MGVEFSSLTTGATGAEAMIARMGTDRQSDGLLKEWLQLESACIVFQML
jgi:hypothetical protein